MNDDLKQEREAFEELANEAVWAKGKIARAVAHQNLMRWYDARIHPTIEHVRNNVTGAARTPAPVQQGDISDDDLLNIYEAMKDAHEGLNDEFWAHFQVVWERICSYLSAPQGKQEADFASSLAGPCPVCAPQAPTGLPRGFGSPPEPVSKPSGEWLDQYAAWHAEQFGDKP